MLDNPKINISSPKIKEKMNSQEFQEHSELFTALVLKNCSLNKIRKFITSKEFKEHPELFTPTTLASGCSLEKIQEIIVSKEYKEHPELFTPTTLARSSLKKIQEIIASKEFKEHPELFTSTTLANSTLERIRDIINMEEWKKNKYKHLLQSTLLVKNKESIKKNIFFAEQYGFDRYITIQYLSKSPSQNYALINYLIDNDYELVVDQKLNSIFSYQPGAIKKRFGIDLKELMIIYPLEEKGEKNEVRRNRHKCIARKL